MNPFVDILRYVDPYAHIVQKDGDGGDSLNRLGIYETCLKYLQAVHFEKYKDAADFFEEAMEKNSPWLGRYCRHPAPGRWFSNVDNTTRDQMITIECAWVLNGKPDWEHLKLRLKRGLFHFSDENDGYDSGLPLVRKFPDPTSPVELAILIRAFRLWPLYPLLYLFDLFLILEVALIRNLKINHWDFDVKLVPCVIACAHRWPTIFSHIAAALYRRTNADERIRYYFRETDGNNGIRPLGEIEVLAWKSL